MEKFKFKSSVVQFFICALLLYVSWYLVYEFIVKPHTLIDEKLISLIVTNAAYLLKLVGYPVYQSIEDANIQLIGIDGAHPVWIGTPCNALTLFMFFTLFVIAFPGNIKNKLWFIPLGIVIIHITNVLRVIGLAMINFYAPQYLAFNHTYTFTVLVYGIIFMLWMWWVNMGLKQKKQHEPQN